MTIKNTDCMYEFVHTKEHYDFVFTDIPYNIFDSELKATEHSLYMVRNVARDGRVKDTETFPLKPFLEQVARCADNGCFIFCSFEQSRVIYDYFHSRSGWLVRPFVWHKVNPMPLNGKSFLLSSIEHAVWAKVKGAPWYGNCVHNCLSCAKPQGRKKRDVCQKPVELIRYVLSAATKEGDSVLDPCMGSGIIPFVAESMGRVATGWEKDSESFDKVSGNFACWKSLL